MIEKKIAIIDDDPFVVAHLKNALQRRMPGVDVVGVVEPVAPAGFEVYIVDREFDGDSRGRDVVNRIRSISPGSLVLAYSAHLDREFLRALLREGCEGAFDKGSLEELDSMIDIIESHFAAGKSGEPAAQGLGNTVRAISGLLREWNLRLENNGRANAKTFSDA
jgi:DNA-binding NarL/FixJ family response regulator